MTEPSQHCRTGTMFVYGSLTFPEVLETILGRVPAQRPAIASGWRVAALHDRPFPVLVPDAADVPGVLLLDVNAAEWRIVDAFEGPGYILRKLVLRGGGNAWAYVAGESAKDWGISPREWNRSSFSADELSSYLVRCVAWRQRYDQSATVDELVAEFGKSAPSPH